MTYLSEALIAMREAKPNDRSELDRCYAVLITDMEKLITLYGAWIEDAPGSMDD